MVFNIYSQVMHDLTSKGMKIGGGIFITGDGESSSFSASGMIRTVDCTAFEYDADEPTDTAFGNIHAELGVVVQFNSLMVSQPLTGVLDILFLTPSCFRPWSYDFTYEVLGSTCPLYTIAINMKTFDAYLVYIKPSGIHLDFFATLAEDYSEGLNTFKPFTLSFENESLLDFVGKRIGYYELKNSLYLEINADITKKTKRGVKKGGINGGMLLFGVESSTSEEVENNPDEDLGITHGI